MNCLAHAYRYLDSPYMAAGTCVPDWLGMIDRKTRVRRGTAQAFLTTAESQSAAHELTRGILQHLNDDAWFHETRAFVELSLGFALELRQLLGADDSFRPSFLGHITVELLLDSCLAEQQPNLLDDYYRCMAEINAAELQATANQLVAKPTELLLPFMPRYLTERFLYDYLDNAKLLARLNRIMARVKLASLPESLLPWLEQARQRVREQHAALLTPEKT